MMQGYDYGYGPMMGGGGGWWWVLIALFWLLVIAGVVLLVVWGIRQLNKAAHGHDAPRTTPYGQQPGGRDEACEIARARYARGEITREQYAEICYNLGVPGPPPPPVPPVQASPLPGQVPPPPGQAPPA